jgi:hypothetical protein
MVAMFETLIKAMVYGLEVYASLGLMFALPFVVFGVQDSEAHGTMVEVRPGSIKLADAVTANQSLSNPETMRALGAVTLTGEIVDSKCYSGVMNPAERKSIATVQRAV